MVLSIHGTSASATRPMSISMILLLALLFISSVATPEIDIPIPSMTMRRTPMTRLIKKIYLYILEINSINPFDAEI